MTLPLVSVCVPLYNGAPFLEACLAGIACQTFRDFEVVLVDDGSSDDGPAIARRYCAEDSRFRFHANSVNLGLVRNWNRCIELAQGTWIKFLFQDDLLEPNGLEALLKAGSAGGGFVACARHVIFEGPFDPAVRAWYGGHDAALRRIYGNGARLTADEFSNAKLSAPELNIVGEPSVTLIRRELFRRYGPFDPALVQLCDSEMWNRLGCNVGIDYLADRLVSFRVHRGSATQANQGRRFRAESLDEIVEWSRLCRSPHLSGFRRFARTTGQWRRLRWGFVQRTNAAYEAARLARLETPPDPSLGRDVHAVLKQLPDYRMTRLAFWAYSVRRLLLGRRG